MKHLKWLFALKFSIIGLFATSIYAQTNSITPNKLQQSQIARGYGMFIHFGVNTFNEIEWSKGNLPASSFNPTNLDCDQWIKTAKEAGFRYVILITKHHDGFCLWDSKFTNYDVGEAAVKTDILAEVSKACKKYGLEFGLYYSLWDRHEPAHNNKNSQVYVDYMKSQLTELLTNYGKICELWFDGGWAKKDEDWHLKEVYNHIKSLQPNCLVTVNHTIRMPGQKKARLPKDMQEGDTIRYFPVDFRTKDPNMARWDDPKLYTYNDTLRYLTFEHTICLSERWNWFQKNNIMPARSIDELEELFYWGTANNNILIVNVPPDQTGQIRENERIALLQLADRLGIRNGKKVLPKPKTNLLFNKVITASDSSYLTQNPPTLINDYSIETWWQAKEKQVSFEIDLSTKTEFNKVVIMEQPVLTKLKDEFSIIRKYNIEDFQIDILVEGAWKCIYRGDNIGACKTLKMPEKLVAEKIRFIIHEAKNAPAISHFALYN